MRNASTRPTGFYYILAAIAVVGAGILGYTMLRKPSGAVGTVIAPGPRAASGPAKGYTIGKADAPVEIVEFADFECPGCGYFAVVSEPDVRKRLVEAGVAKFTFMDFPLTIHKNTLPAHNAAACADDQGRFWQMHDRLFATQDQWNGQAADNPRPFFEKYAADLGLDKDAWAACYDARKHEGRIMANVAEGERRKINTTPSFIVGEKMYVGALGYDALKAIVDSATRK
ncbi:MAG TPA: thioredoxin domain-containing protein [Gemmatimonadaceae bacterium]|nr:thioredoxin domain-containing protein [Gemmatimonadaceae bacterium]